MKRSILFLLILCLLFSLLGCRSEQENSAYFYYLRSTESIRYGQPDALVAPVKREISDQNAELEYILQLYLDGTTDENYRNPFPQGTYMLSTLWHEDTLVLVLSREFSTLEGIRLTLAGACLTATCSRLAGAQQIQVRSGDQIYDFSIDDFTFLDSSAGE